MVVPSTHAQTHAQTTHHKNHTKTTRRPRAKLRLPKVAVGRGGLSSVREASGPRLDRVDGVHLTVESSQWTYYPGKTWKTNLGYQWLGQHPENEPGTPSESPEIQTAVLTISVTANPKDKL